MRQCRKLGRDPQRPAGVLQQDNELVLGVTAESYARQPIHVWKIAVRHSFNTRCLVAGRTASHRRDPQRLDFLRPGGGTSRPRLRLVGDGQEKCPPQDEPRAAHRADVARLLSAAALAQLEAVVDDPDNVCHACDELISSEWVEVILLAGKPLMIARLAHPGCLRSCVYPGPGPQRQLEWASDACARGGFEMATVLALRPNRPHALLFLEPATLIAGLGQDPLEIWALGLGLSPVSGEIEQLAPPPTDAFTIARRPAGLALHHSCGTDTVCAEPAEVDDWWRAAEGKALVVTARGLGLRRAERAIEEAVRLRPPGPRSPRLRTSSRHRARTVRCAASHESCSSLLRDDSDRARPAGPEACLGRLDGPTVGAVQRPTDANQLNPVSGRPLEFQRP